MKIPYIRNINIIIPYSCSNGSTQAQKEQHEDDPLDVKGSLQLKKTTLALGLSNTAHDFCIMASIKYYDDDDNNNDVNGYNNSFYYCDNDNDDHDHT